MDKIRIKQGEFKKEVARGILAIGLVRKFVVFLSIDTQESYLSRKDSYMMQILFQFLPFDYIAYLRTCWNEVRRACGQLPGRVGTLSEDSVLVSVSSDCVHGYARSVLDFHCCQLSTQVHSKIDYLISVRFRCRLPDEPSDAIYNVLASGNLINRVADCKTKLSDGHCPYEGCTFSNGSTCSSFIYDRSDIKYSALQRASPRFNKLNLLNLVGHCLRPRYLESSDSIMLLHRANVGLSYLWLSRWQVSLVQSQLSLWDVEVLNSRNGKDGVK